MVIITTIYKIRLDIWFEKIKMHHGKLWHREPTRQNGAGSRSQDVEQGGGEQEPQVLCLSKMWPGVTFNIVTDHQNEVVFQIWSMKKILQKFHIVLLKDEAGRNV